MIGKLRRAVRRWWRGDRVYPLGLGRVSLIQEPPEYALFIRHLREWESAAHPRRPRVVQR